MRVNLRCRNAIHGPSIFLERLLRSAPPRSGGSQGMAESNGDLHFSQFQLVLAVFLMIKKIITRVKVFLPLSGFAGRQIPHVLLGNGLMLRNFLPINIQIFQGGPFSQLVLSLFIAFSHHAQKPYIFKDLPIFSIR